MLETKVQFSDPELQLMCDAELILTKNKIIEKVKYLLEGVQRQMMLYVESKEVLKNHALFSIPPKISKGENYGGLPYLILDYPRNFGHQQTIAIRTMFWWGRFFSSTLHISGDVLIVREKLEGAFSMLQRNYYLGINEDPWQHHFETDNYLPIASFTKEAFKQHLHTQSHIKIAAKWPLSKEQPAANTLFESWKFLVDFLPPSHPGDEKDLLPGDPKGGFGL
ncbi:MAG TPA: hypothetical protein VM888_04110 [Chitinophagaceae bacterium]|nr:hypothetical protein [Chitinophagaceae bacterium]